MRMKQTFVLLAFLLTPFLFFGQNLGIKREKPDIDLYKIITADRDTTFLDTTLSIQKEYKYNYLRRDNFELLPFSNVGQTYNSLAYSFDKLNLLPLFVAQSHHFNYLDTEDMLYYEVPTPLTDIYFKTAFEQGQQLDAFFTVNTSNRFNFSVAYKGVRSLGKYQHILTSTGNFRFTTNYRTQNNRYRLRAHIAAQDILNRENGGLTESSLVSFINDEPDFEDRSTLDVNFEDGENKLEGLRFYGEQEYDLIKKKDSTGYAVLTLGGVASIEDKDYEWRQTSAFDGFGEALVTSDIRDKVTLSDFRAKGYARFDNSVIGTLSAFIGYNSYNYGYNSVFVQDAGRITNRLKGDLVQFGATYRKNYKGFELYGKGAINLTGDLDGNYIMGSAKYAFDEDNVVKASATLHSSAPNFNFLLFQSSYVNYNWQNDFNNVKTQELRFDLESKKFFNASVSYTGIDDYAYFGIPAGGTTPVAMQADTRVDYVKVKVEREFRYGKFALMNTVMYQQALSGGEVFNVPEIITRNSLYYEDEWFKKALFVQTGINFKYFTKYNMNAYDPLLAEFYVQNDQELGGFPLVDIFFNAKVRQTRIFIKYEHINSLFVSKNEFFSAPGYPYRDAVLRFGLVWNFFL